MKVCVVQLFCVIIFGIFLLVGCTLSFNNICSIGKAQDVVDTEQDPTNDVKPNIQVPSPLYTIKM
jgi:hypothetical protein